MIKFVSDLRQVGDFLRVFRFPPPIKLTEILLKVALNTITIPPQINKGYLCPRENDLSFNILHYSGHVIFKEI